MDSEFERIRDEAETLTPFATAFRYPGDVLEPELCDVEEGMLFAQRIVDLVVALMPDEVTKEIA